LGNLRIGHVAARASRYEDLMEKLRAEASGCYSWSNAAGDRYAPHSHSY